MCTAPLPSGERDTPSPNPSPSAPRPRAFGTQPRHLRRLIPLFLFLMLAYLLLYLNLLTCSTCYPSVCLVTRFLGDIFMYNYCIPCNYLFLSSLFTSYIWSLVSGDPFVCLSPLPYEYAIMFKLGHWLKNFFWYCLLEFQSLRIKVCSCPVEHKIDTDCYTDYILRQMSRVSE